MSIEYDPSDLDNWGAGEHQATYDEQRRQEERDDAAAAAERQQELDLVTTQGTEDRALEQQTAEQSRATLQKGYDLVSPYITDLLDDGTTSSSDGTDGTDGNTRTEAEDILIQAQEEAKQSDIDELSDEYAQAGILSSGAFGKGVSNIIGSTRAGIAETLANASESEADRENDRYLAQQDTLTSLINSVLG